MIDDSESLINKTFENDTKEILGMGRIGIEKESLRVFQCTISRKQHQESMGSPLFNRYITTDFSEAQLELITPPLTDKKIGLNLLRLKARKFFLLLYRSLVKAKIQFILYQV